MKENLRKSLLWAVVISESSHIFCCVLPTIFSLVGLLAGLGVVTVMPTFMVRAHDLIHQWELPMIVVSACVLALGWAAVLYSDKVDCHSTGCAHGACAPKKSRAHMILTIATILFVFNVLVYGLIHRSTWFSDMVAAQHEHEHGHEGGGPAHE